MNRYFRYAYYLFFTGYLLFCQLVLWRAIKNRRLNFAVPIALITNSVLISLLLLEVVLSTGVFDDNYVWIPLRLKVCHS